MCALYRQVIGNYVDRKEVNNNDTDWVWRRRRQLHQQQLYIVWVRERLFARWICTIMIGKQSIIIKKSLSNNDSLLCGIKTIISAMITITVIILYIHHHYLVVYAQSITEFQQATNSIQFFRTESGNGSEWYWKPEISKGKETSCTLSTHITAHSLSTRAHLILPNV